MLSGYPLPGSMPKDHQHSGSDLLSQVITLNHLLTANGLTFTIDIEE
jgi:hypothetical protein